jgi:beta-lactamase regulating signal transducer with metallopeptidase domain
LPTSTPLCLLAGIFRPTLFLSRGLLAAMGPESVAVLLHHERAHAARRDLLLRLLARAGTLFLWPSVRMRLLEALELAAEQSCDEVAASKVGDRLQVADAILRVERLLHSAVSPLAPLAVSFGGATVPQRVSALLEAPRRAGNLSALGMVFASLSLSTLAASAPLHHWTESLLEALVH